MNPWGALRAAGAGVVAVMFFLFATFIHLWASLSGGGMFFTTWEYEDMSGGSLFVWYVIVPIVLALGGALPALATGTGWARSFSTSIIVLSLSYLIFLRFSLVESSRTLVAGRWQQAGSSPQLPGCWWLQQEPAVDRWEESHYSALQSVYLRQ